MLAQGTSVRLRIGGLKDPQDDGGEEVESREKPKVLNDGIRRVRHDVGVDRDGRELLPRTSSKEAEVKARLGRTPRALEEPEDDVLGCEVGGEVSDRVAQRSRTTEHTEIRCGPFRQGWILMRRNQTILRHWSLFRMAI